MNKKYAIYSVVTRSYDYVRQPVITDERFDYILFSDKDIGTTIGVWQVREIRCEEKNAIVKSRYPKILAQKVLDGYEASLYIDANVQIKSKFVYERFIELVNENVEWAGIRHPKRDCIYEEIYTILTINLINVSQAVDCYCSLKRNGFPEHFGLFENNIIFRRHTPKVNDVCNQWWDRFIQGGKRDQIYLMPALCEIAPETTFLFDNCDNPTSPREYFDFSGHNKYRPMASKTLRHLVLHWCIRASYPDDVRKGYHVFFTSLSRYRHPELMLNVLIFCLFLKNFQKIAYQIIEKNITSK